MEPAIFVPKVNGFFSWGFSRGVDGGFFHNHVVTSIEKKIFILLKNSALRWGGSNPSAPTKLLK